MANRSYHPKTPIENRFWPKVDVCGRDECWPWLASRHRQGYGQIGDSNGGLLRAHRVAWSLANGPAPEGMSVLHKCDNPPCCNPAHLFLGTQLDNVRDAIAKGRMRVVASLGERNGTAKLTDDAVRRIRSLRGSRSQQKLAAEFGVSQRLISLVLRGEIWRHV